MHINNLALLLIINLFTLAFQIYLYSKISEIKNLFFKLQTNLTELDSKINRLIKNIEDHGFKINI